VDENITVALHTLDGADRSAPPVPAGGENQPWSVSVANPPSGVTTVVASTGGGLTAHGRFAVVGIKIGG
jgi:hypothetical protein